MICSQYLSSFPLLHDFFRSTHSFPHLARDFFQRSFLTAYMYHILQPNSQTCNPYVSPQGFQTAVVSACPSFSYSVSLIHLAYFYAFFKTRWHLLQEVGLSWPESELQRPAGFSPVTRFDESQSPICLLCYSFLVQKDHVESFVFSF